MVDENQNISSFMCHFVSYNPSHRPEPPPPRRLESPPRPARRPYSDVCTHFVYEEGTDTCYFKAADAAGGRVGRAGYTAGEVVLK